MSSHTAYRIPEVFPTPRLRHSLWGARTIINYQH